jgi:acetyl-CoA synthetase/medium-chain acyl-CoA synthetase
MHNLYRAGASAPAHFNFATDVFDFWAETQPAAPALWCVAQPSGAAEILSYATLARLSRRAAALFLASGIRPGDRVLLMLPRQPQWWIAFLGLIRMGAVAVPATLLLTHRDVAFRLETARVKAVITSPEGVSRSEGFLGVRLMTGGGGNGWIDFDQELARTEAIPSFPRTRSEDDGLVYFTSATTGDPKMVLHTQASYGLGPYLTGRYWLDLKPADVHWNISDLGWGKAAWSSFFGPWHMGSCVFALGSSGKFDPAATLTVLEQFPITTWCAPPTALRLIVREDLGKRRFPALRHCVTAGEPLNPEVLEIWRRATGLTLHEAYGQTETVVLAGNFASMGHEVAPGSMGRATPGFQLEILDEELRPVPAGQEGQIAIRIAPERPLGLFREYWLNPEETAHKFQGDYYLTGDRASQDAEGRFWFIGRQDDVIKSSGYRIGPFEVESALLEHPAVLEAAVVGKADALRGNIVKAFVVLRAGRQAQDDLKHELQQHCKQLVAAYKYPREIEFVDALPKTISGKTRHVELRKRGSR